MKNVIAGSLSFALLFSQTVALAQSAPSDGQMISREAVKEMTESAMNHAAIDSILDQLEELHKLDLDLIHIKKAQELGSISNGHLTFYISGAVLGTMVALSSGTILRSLTRTKPVRAWEAAPETAAAMGADKVIVLENFFKTGGTIFKSDAPKLFLTLAGVTGASSAVYQIVLDAVQASRLSEAVERTKRAIEWQKSLLMHAPILHKKKLVLTREDLEAIHNRINAMLTGQANALIEESLMSSEAEKKLKDLERSDDPESITIPKSAPLITALGTIIYIGSRGKSGGPGMGLFGMGVTAGGVGLSYVGISIQEAELALKAEVQERRSLQSHYQNEISNLAAVLMQFQLSDEDRHAPSVSDFESSSARAILESQLELLTDLKRMQRDFQVLKATVELRSREKTTSRLIWIPAVVGSVLLAYVTGKNLYQFFRNNAAVRATLAKNEVGVKGYLAANFLMFGAADLTVANGGFLLAMDANQSIKLSQAVERSSQAIEKVLSELKAKAESISKSSEMSSDDKREFGNLLRDHILDAKADVRTAQTQVWDARRVLEAKRAHADNDAQLDIPVAIAGTVAAALLFRYAGKSATLEETLDYTMGRMVYGGFGGLLSGGAAGRSVYRLTVSQVDLSRAQTDLEFADTKLSQELSYLDNLQKLFLKAL